MMDKSEIVPKDTLSATGFSRDGLWAVLILFALPWIFYFPAWLWPMAHGDNMLEEWQTARFAMDQLRNGVDPLWNAFLCSGFPVAGYPNTGIYSILNVFHLFLPHVVALTFLIMTFHGLAGAGQYIFLRRIGLSVQGALLGGAAFAFSGFMLSAPDYSYFIAGAAFIGFFLWAIEGVRTATTKASFISRTLICILLFSIQLLAGHPQITVISGLIYAIYIVWFFFAGGPRRQWRLPAAGAFVVIVAAFITAAGWMPAMELLKYSFRENISWGRFIGLSITPFELPAHALLLSSGQLNESYVWIGIPVVLLAWRAARDEWRQPMVKFLTVCLLAAAAMTLGRFMPFYKLLFHLPFVKSLAAPIRYALDFCFAASCLAAFGWDSLRKSSRVLIQPGRNTILFSVLILLCMVVISLQNKFAWIQIFPDILAGFLAIRMMAHRSETNRNKLAATIILMALCVLPGWVQYGGPWFRNGDPRPEKSPHWEKVNENIAGNPSGRVINFVYLKDAAVSVLRGLPAQNINIINRWSYAAGYQPMILDRYSRLLGMDFVGFVGNPQRLLALPDRSLDLLNVRCLLIPSSSFTNPNSFFRRVNDKKTFQGVTFGESIDLHLGTSTSFGFRPPELTGMVSGLAMISGMSFAADIPQGEEVAKISLNGQHNESRVLKIRAGIESAESMYQAEEEQMRAAKTIRGIPFFTHIDLPIWTGLTHKFSFKAREVKGVAMTSYLFNADSVKQAAPVASVTFIGDDGSEKEFILRAGVDTAQWTAGNPTFKVDHRPAIPAETIEAGGVTGRIYLSEIKIDPPVQSSSIAVKCLLKEKNSGIFISQITFLNASGKYSSMDTTGIAHNKAQTIPVSGSGRGYLYFTRWDFPPINPHRIELKGLMKDYPHAALAINAMTFLKNGNQSWPVHPVDVALGNSDRFDVQYEDDLAVVIKNKTALPRAWFTDESVVLTPEKILETIKTSKLPNGRDFDPLKTALIERRLPQPTLMTSANPPQIAEIRFEEYSANRLRLRADTPKQAMLVLSEIYYPGWETIVDGKPVETLQVDYVLRGVLLGPGSHEVVMRFRPATVRKGRIISLTTLAIVLTALMVSVGLSKRRRYF